MTLYVPCFMRCRYALYRRMRYLRTQRASELQHELDKLENDLLKARPEY